MIRLKNAAPALVVAALGVSSLAARAEGECDKYQTAYDSTYCYARLFLESDKELNAVYSDLRRALRPDMQQKLKSVQLDWIQYRDETCSRGNAINVNCNYRVNRERAEYLRDRLRECKAGTCRDDKIADKPWRD